MALQFDDETTSRATASLRRFCKEHLDQEIGELKARLMLEYILKEIGPSVYNGAIADAQRYMSERIADLDGACAEPEFAYWPRSTTRRSPN